MTSPDGHWIRDLEAACCISCRGRGVSGEALQQLDQENSWGLRVVAISQPEKENISILTINIVRLVKQSILKEINPEYSLEGLMLKLKLRYFGHLMQSQLIRKDPDDGKD